MNAPNLPPLSPLQRVRADFEAYVRLERPLEGLTPEDRKIWGRRVAGARRALDAARRLRTGDPRSALTLLREAALELWPHWREEEKRQGIVVAYPGSARTRLDWAAAPLGPSELDALSKPELESICDELEAALGPVLEHGRRAADDVQSARLRAIARRTYLVGSLLALVAFVVLTAGGYRWLIRGQNLARGAKVTASVAGFNTTVKNINDGHRYGQLGYHSQQEKGPWLLVDMGRQVELDEVIAFGRGDCCFDQSIPLFIQASKDGKEFRDLGERKLPFSHFDPWVLKLPKPVRARYVRFQARKTGFLVLSEVEIYGR
jgi:hypothetical protein